MGVLGRIGSGRITLFHNPCSRVRGGECCVGVEVVMVCCWERGVTTQGEYASAEGHKRLDAEAAQGLDGCK